MGGLGSGGPHGGPQYDPANVSAIGGAGQSGDYTGFAYGQNRQINQNRVAGNQAVKSIMASQPTTDAQYGAINFPELGTLTGDNGPMTNPTSHGVDFGRGAGREALPMSFQNNTRPDENAQIVKNYLPDLALAAQSPNAPDSFKRFVNYLAGL